MTKRITSLFLVLIMLLTCSAGTTISYASDNAPTVNESETVIIDGKEYKYEDVFVNGKEITRIINLTDNTEDLLYYDIEKKVLYS